MSALATIKNVAETVFLNELESYAREHDILSEEETYVEIVDYIGIAIDEALDENGDNYTQNLLLCCLEKPTLFTWEPKGHSCISSNGSPGQVNARHCVYHNLYDLLHSELEKEFSEWHQRISAKIA